MTPGRPRRGLLSAPGSRDEGWAARLKVAAFLALYVTGLWGQAGRLLPAPLSDWHDIPYRLVAPWWHDHVLPQLSRAEQATLFQVFAAYLLALLLPLLVLRRLGIGPVAAGLGRVRSSTTRAGVLGLLVGLPAGFWLVAVTPDPWGSPLQELLEFMTLIPEHFLVFGVLGVLLMPTGELRWRPGGAGLFVVGFAALLFGLLHVGTPHAAELWLSFPLGALFAVVTLATGSIWPAVLAHVTLNLIPMAVQAVLG